MATVYLLNTTSVRISVNLNAELQNHILDPRIDDVQGKAVVLPAWGAPLAAMPGPGVFGCNSSSNLLTVFSEQLPIPALYEISSSVSLTLDLYFYVLADTVAGADQTGTTSGITVKVVSPELAARLAALLAALHADATAAGQAQEQSMPGARSSLILSTRHG